MFKLKDIPVKKFIVVGSYALGTRYAKDIDLICSRSDIDFNIANDFVEIDSHTLSFVFNNKKIECLLIEQQPSLKELYDYYLIARSLDIVEASREVLFSLKASHIHRVNSQWEKHIHDYHNLKSSIDDSYLICNKYSIGEFSKYHSKVLDTLLGAQIQVPLKNVTIKDFFNDHVKRDLDHDWLHEVFKHKEHPMYTYLLLDTEHVYCCPFKWKEFSEEDKIKCVLEETYVTAIERYLAPMYFRKPDSILTEGVQIDSFKKSLIKVCTTMCSGFFRDFAINNYFMILNSMDSLYFDKFLKEYKHVNGLS